MPWRWANKTLGITLLVMAPMLLAAPRFLPKPVPSKRPKSANISLDFQEIKVRTALQLLAQFSGLNLIIDGQVQSSMSLHLEDIPSKEALAVILRSQGLAQYSIGTVVFIAPQEQLLARQKAEWQLQQQLNDLAALQSKHLAIHYSKATEVASILQGQGSNLLSNRGHISVDPRTNSVWVQDTPNRLKDIQEMITQFDIPVQQILIEARIVNIDRGFEQELGVRFGLSYPPHLSGSLAGANQLATGKSIGDIPFKERLNVDLPAVNEKLQPASIGLALARLGKNIFLDLELSALESAGSGQIISSPHLITTNQQAAVIEAGEEVPYQEKTSSGATSITFKKAVLSLHVTPQIMPRNRIMLNLKVNQDQPSSSIKVQDMLAIDTREIQTQVSVEDGETVVLGGIYEHSQSKTLHRIPFLGSLPILGYLFSHSAKWDQRKELLIFVTPHIIDQNGKKSNNPNKG